MCLCNVCCRFVPSRFRRWQKLDGTNTLMGLVERWWGSSFVCPQPWQPSCGLHLLSSFCILPAPSVDCRGLEKKGEKFFRMIPLRCSSLVLEVLEVTVLFLWCHCRCWRFLPSWAKLSILFFSPVLSRRGAFVTCFSRPDYQEVVNCHAELKAAGGCCCCCFCAKPALCPTQRPR